MGLYTDNGPPDWHNAKQEVKQAVREAFKYCYENNIDLKKLAYGFSTNQQGIDLTLSSFATCDLLDQNIKYFNEWNDFNAKLADDIQQKYDLN